MGIVEASRDGLILGIVTPSQQRAYGTASTVRRSLAERLLADVAGTDIENWRLAAGSAKRAIQGHLSFWDGALRLICVGRRQD